jgi:para-nitrobenzyl esterase
MGISRRQFGTGSAALIAGVAAQGLWSRSSAQGLGRRVEIASGRLRGGYADGVSHYLGIPYGADAGGANRFLPPNPAAPWAGVRDAILFGSNAPQTNPDAEPIDSPLRTVFQSPLGPDYIQESEDCLRLNVWTPASGMQDKKPVLVWLHGGGFASGTGSWDVYNGANFARTNDAVVVSVNHRLNMFGYAYMAEAMGEDYLTSGNAGMLDIVLALRWVADNIAVFGGDPDNVTIRGQSGGGSKVSMLLAMPSAHGLFHKAIIESGPGLRARETAEAASAATRLIDALGGTDKLKSASKEELLRAYFAVLQDPNFDGRFSPVMDGAALPRHPYDPDATPLSAQIPLLIGSTLHERALNMFGQTIADQAALIAAVRNSVPEGETEEIIAAYRAAYPQESLRDIAIFILTDSGTGVRTRLLADRKSAQPAPVYVYRFDWETKVLGGALRATHGICTPFIFNNTEFAPLVGDDPAAGPLAEKVCRSWGAFMRNGDPSADDGLGPWPQYASDDRQTMLINNESALARDPNGDLLDMFG